MARIPPVTGQYWHIYNRGILKQPIFLDTDDYLRFLRDVQRFNVAKIGSREIGSRGSKALVAILAWCLMPNHFHLFVYQLQDGGASLFMQRLGIGFTMYMNRKYGRSGHLFESKYKTKHVENDAHFLHLSRYIHLNPLILSDSDWESDGVKDVFHAHESLIGYRWSSYADWLGKGRFPQLLDTDRVRELARATGDYGKFVRDWISRDPISIEGQGV